MNAQDLFFYWINERHRIFLKREGGESPPFTEDPILQKYKFTNVFRELDRTTRWLKPHIRDKFEGPDLVWWMCLFRNTGTIEAGIEMLLLDSLANKMVTNFDEDTLGRCLVKFQERGGKLFTGGYMVTCQYPDAQGKPKIISLLKHCLRHIHRDKELLYDFARKDRTLEGFVNRLMCYNGFGGNGFMAYEVASDLRHTGVLGDATDIFSWANPGPGAQRGLSRYFGRYDPATKNKQIATRKQTVAEMRHLLDISPMYLEPHVPALEMRDIEHSLCEYDKYMRVLTGEGRPKGLFHGGVF
jgi:hypothetical protein